MRRSQRPPGFAMMSFFSRAALVAPGMLALLALPVPPIVAPYATQATAQQPCNPIVDGTYCATQMPQPRSPAARATSGLPPIESIGSDVFPNQDQPGTLGAITFQGYGTRCIGLLRQSRCN
ncbi:MAG: hypothetical protein HXY30_03415 [Pseudorhodoplanes sp.]|nr:hypothetical protein [Pseudorhodoplanes sp.]